MIEFVFLLQAFQAFTSFGHKIILILFKNNNG